MNPSKVGKMDEEVQKWSRKDPQAIKKAMVYPGMFNAWSSFCFNGLVVGKQVPPPARDTYNTKITASVVFLRIIFDLSPTINFKMLIL